MPKIFLGADHAGYELKEEIKEFLIEEGYEVEDLGAHEYDEKDDYPDYIIPAAEKVAKNDALGIIIGGSGQGEAIAANKVPGVRTVVFYGPRQATKQVEIEGRESRDPYEIIRLARTHNAANILSIGVRFVTDEEAKKAAKLFVETSFEGKERHERRIDKVSRYEESR